jgi:uncharacterized protein (DUF2141 family)
VRAVWVLYVLLFVSCCPTGEEVTMILRKYFLPLLLLSVVTGTSALSQDLSSPTQAVSELRIKVIGLGSSNGTVKFSLFNSEESYAKRSNPLMEARLPIQEQTCEWVVQDLPYGEYSVILYHDENGNTKLDTNFVGIPKESYGFSNNAKAMFGPPKYEKAKFVFDGKTKTLEIHLIR